MDLAEIVKTSAAVGGTRSRKKKAGLLATLLADRDPAELRIVVPWLSGEMRQGRIGVGWATLAAVRDTPPAAASSLTVFDVDLALTAIADISGKGSNARREEALRGLLGLCTPDEQAFLAQLILGELRQGALAGVMAEGVALAAGVSADKVRRAAMLSGDLAAAALAGLVEGEEALARFRLHLFRPVQPMLAQTAEDVPEALSHLGRAALEVKLDGARVQVHRQGDKVRVFTRHLRDVTRAVPEVVAAARALPVQEAILDGEVLALRPDGTPHPFQTTMRRFGRKLDVAAMQRGLPLTPFFFDVLHADGEEWIDAPQHERFGWLVDRLPDGLVIPHTEIDEAGSGEAFLRDAIAEGHEGVMAKDPGATYEAGSRGRAWLKIKPAHTLDLVVLAAEWGSGRRKGWLSNLHLGARDGDGFAMLGKTFKGLTDDMLAWQTEALLAREVSREGHVVHVRPEIVAEIAFNEVQESPRYASGLALRFARVKRYRPDKPATEADTLETVRAIHEGRLRPEV